MSRRKNTSAEVEKDATKVTWKGFLNLKLSKEEKAHIGKNLLSGEQVVKFVEQANFMGYKFSASWSAKQDCYTATLYGNVPDHPDAGYALSIKHVDFTTAVTGLHWCLDEAGKDGSLFAWLGDDGDLDW